MNIFELLCEGGKCDNWTTTLKVILQIIAYICEVISIIIFFIILYHLIRYTLYKFKKKKIREKILKYLLYLVISFTLFIVFTTINNSIPAEWIQCWC